MRYTITIETLVPRMGYVAVDEDRFEKVESFEESYIDEDVMDKLKSLKPNQRMIVRAWEDKLGE